MQNNNPLSNLVTAFEQWREKRIKGKDLVPQSLRSQAVALKRNYSTGRITSALKISGGQFKQWCEVLHPAKKTIDFVPLPTLDIEKQKNLKLQLYFPDDTQLCLSGDISEALLSTLIREIRA